MKIYCSAIAKNKLKKLTSYLLENWSLQVKINFLKKLDNKILQI